LYKDSIIERIQQLNDNWEISRPEKGDKSFETLSGIPINRLYTPLDVIDGDFERDINFPEEYPFTRGINADMYREKPWILGHYSGFGCAKDTNERFKYLLQQGDASLSIALDLPTQLGYDSDHPLAEGEVGRVGVAIDSLRDMEIIFEGIPLKNTRVVTTANSISPIMLAMFIALAEKKSISTNEFILNMQNDILKEYIARGTYIYPIKHGLRVTNDTVEYAVKNIPNWVPINFCGYHVREAGCNAIQEIAFTFANAMLYIEDLLKRGLDIDEFAPQISAVFVASQIDFFEEIAKFRAMRRVWAKLMRDKYTAKNPESWKLTIRVYTSGSALTAQQPLNNIVRVTLETLAAVLGGVQRIAASSMDEALALPSDEAVRVAARTQQILNHEPGVTSTVDPLGGSYYVESLTNKMEEEILSYIKKIEKMGGMLKAIEQGFAQSEISDQAYKQKNDIEMNKKIVVGVNKYQIEEKLPIKLLKVNQNVQREQLKNIQKLKSERNNEAVNLTLMKVKYAAEKGINLVPSILQAVKEYATIGEISDVLRDVFGRYNKNKIF